jgi:hypothetical protein
MLKLAILKEVAHDQQDQTLFGSQYCFEGIAITKCLTPRVQDISKGARY